MTLLIIEHNVQNFDSWKAAFDNHETVRLAHNLPAGKVFQGADDPHNVCVMFEGELNDLQAFLADPSLKPAMQEAGVVGEPIIQILDGQVLAA